MSTPPPPPLDPSDPRAGDPTKIATWIAIGGLILTVIVIGTITHLNGGTGGGHALSAVAPSSTPSPSPTTSGTTPSGIYKVVFEGTAVGHYDVPNRGQAYRSSDATATWHLEYKVGDGSYLPDPTSTIVTGSGTSQVWPSNQHDCTSGSPAYTPNVSILKQTGSGNTFTLTSPFMGDLVDKTGSCLSYTKAWYSSCGTGSTGCPDLAAFWTASFTIAPGQAGTVVTQIPKRHLDYINNQPTLGGDHAVDSWSGTITVIAL